jgi:hypothetical protein
MADALQIFAGREAARQLARDGWHADRFRVLLGASGGPKCFALAGLDSYLFGDFLARGTRPLATLGSSVGAWRHACLAQADPAAAVARFTAAYSTRTYSARPDAAEITGASREILQTLLGEDGAQALAGHPRIRQHIVTARGRGPCAGRHPIALPLGLAAAAAGNALHRGLLQSSFQRVLFASHDDMQDELPLAGFDTQQTVLSAENALEVLLATASIPLLLEGVENIPGAPPGQYWDGGIIDYHFDLAAARGEGLILFPHFGSRIVPGWFDKRLRRRHTAPEAVDRLVLLCPHPDFVARLPGGKIPDRDDFRRLPTAKRERRWQHCLAESEALGASLAARVEGRGDPLAGVITPPD